MDKIVLKFTQTQFIKENMWPNIGYLYGKV